MTHFIGLIMCETEAEIESLVEKYCEHNEVEPYFETIENLEEMKNYYINKEANNNSGIIVDEAYLLSAMEDWSGNKGAIIDGVLGCMATYNPDSTWDWFSVGGRWNGMVPNNNCLASEIATHFTEYLPGVIVTEENGWQSSKDYGWFGMSNPTETPDIVAETLAANPDKRVWVVDFHI